MKSNKKLRTLIGFLALALIVGTLAFFSSELSIDNPFATKQYGGELVEKFTPENNWEPGGQVTKEVQAKNTGDYSLYVRVKFDEKWMRDGKEFSSYSSTDQAAFFPTSANNSVQNGSSVYKHLIGVEDGSWINGNDGYFYYKSELASKEMTSKLMDYVTLCKDANMGTYKESQIKYALVDQSVSAEELKDSDYNLSTLPDTIPDGKVVYQKKVISLDEENAGFAGANYTLTITTQLVQTNADAATGWSYIPSK